MKKIITTLLLTTMFIANAQVIIGDAVGTTTVKTSVLLEFAANQNKGLILPYVRTIPSGAKLTEGTILLDASNPTQARVKYYNGTWKDLSGQAADFTTPSLLPNFGTEQPTTIIENTNSKAIIGASSSAADGVLVLESTRKAMVLPTVTDVQLIPSPSPGMMVYINKTGAKRLAVFNGSKWSFWKP